MERRGRKAMSLEVGFRRINAAATNRGVFAGCVGVCEALPIGRALNSCVCRACKLARVSSGPVGGDIGAFAVDHGKVILSDLSESSGWTPFVLGASPTIASVVIGNPAAEAAICSEPFWRPPPLGHVTALVCFCRRGSNGYARRPPDEPHGQANEFAVQRACVGSYGKFSRNPMPCAARRIAPRNGP